MLLSQSFPCLSVLGRVYEKTFQILKRLRPAGDVLALATQGDAFENLNVIYTPDAQMLAVAVIPPVAYYCAVLNDRDVDKPRNLLNPSRWNK